MAEKLRSHGLVLDLSALGDRLPSRVLGRRHAALYLTVQRSGGQPRRRLQACWAMAAG